MVNKEFDEFVKRQQAQKTTVAAINWNGKRDEWLNSLDTLYKLIESFLVDYLSAEQAECGYREIQLNEENIGSYNAKQLVLKIGLQEVTFTPIGTLLIGSKGRVDVVGPAGRTRLVLIDKRATSARSLIKVTTTVVVKGKTPPAPPPASQPAEPIEWVWKIVSSPPEMKFTDLTKEAFFEMILEVVNA